MADDIGRSPDGSGHSAKPEPISVVSAQGASVPSADEIATYRAMHAVYEVCLALSSFMNSKHGTGADGRVWQELHKIADVAFSAWSDAVNYMRTHENAACPQCVRRADEITLAKWGPEFFAMMRPNSAIAMETRRAETGNTD